MLTPKQITTIKRLHWIDKWPLRQIERLSFANNGSAYKLLCSNAFITVVESAELWNCNDLSVAQRLSRKRTLFAEAQMGPRIMVVAEITRQR